GSRSVVSPHPGPLPRGEGTAAARPFFNAHWLGKLRRGYGRETADNSLHEPRLHRDNCLLQVQHRIVLASSWFRCAIVRSWKLPMNLPSPGLPATLSPPCGERAGRGCANLVHVPNACAKTEGAFP